MGLSPSEGIVVWAAVYPLSAPDVRAGVDERGTSEAEAHGEPLRSSRVIDSGSGDRENHPSHLGQSRDRT